MGHCYTSSGLFCLALAFVARDAGAMALLSNSLARMTLGDGDSQY